MKIKKRFLRCKIEFADKLNEAEAKKLVDAALSEAVGSMGVAETEFEFKKFDAEMQVFWAKCAPKAVDTVIAAMALKRFHDGKDVALRLEKVSASLK